VGLMLLLPLGLTTKHNHGNKRITVEYD